MVYKKVILVMFFFILNCCAVPSKKRDSSVSAALESPSEISSLESASKEPDEQESEPQQSDDISSFLKDLETDNHKEPEQQSQIQEIIKIGILETSYPSSINFSGSGIIVKDNYSEKILELTEARDYRIKKSNSGIALENNYFSSELKLSPKDSGTIISVNNKRYRGNIIVKVSGSKLIFINEIELENYVCGIITKEISASWPEESLKAQAVVARTYALKNMNRHKNDGYNLCATQHCQVYGGLDAEDDRSNNAVFATRGQVLQYDGQIANTFYHSSCGGRTESASLVWNLRNKIPYVTGVKCGYCGSDPWKSWSYKLRLSDMAKLLSKSGYPIKKIKRIKLTGKTASGRVKTVTVYHSNGKYNMTSHKFRMAMGTQIIRSTNFSARISGGYAYFKGHGWGHGVGMCQWGAKGMAEAGWNYKKILKHYYRGSKIKDNYGYEE